VIPSSVVFLGDSSLSGCDLLGLVTFESGSRLEHIGECALCESGLISIAVSPSVTFIDGSLFIAVCASPVPTPTNHRNYRIREDFLEDFEGSTIYGYLGTCCSVVIPSSVAVLGRSSCRESQPLESVTFESGSLLELIEESAFRESMLKSIVIPSSVVVLGKSSFSECKSLESVIFENGSQLARIEEFAFYESGLTKIEIPSSVVVLGKSSFS
jgi:hypothetical protein